MVMNVGIDLDQVIIPNHIVWAPYVNSKFKEHSHKELIYDGEALSWNYIKDVCAKCWNECLHNPDIVSAHHCRERVPKALEIITGIGIQLHLITSRPKDVHLLTLDWLDKHGLSEYFSTVNLTSDKLALAKVLGITHHLDDAPDKITQFYDSNILPVIWHTDYNSHMKGIRVRNWDEFVSFIYHAYNVHAKFAEAH